MGFAYLYPFKERGGIACYSGLWRRWKKVIALNCKARKLETFKPGNKYLRNGIGKVECGLSCGHRDQRTLCNAFQTLLYIYDTWGDSRLQSTTGQKPWCPGMGLLMKYLSAAQKSASSFSCAEGVEFISEWSGEGGVVQCKKKRVVSGSLESALNEVGVLVSVLQALYFLLLFGWKLVYFTYATEISAWVFKYSTWKVNVFFCRYMIIVNLSARACLA